MVAANTNFCVYNQLYKFLGRNESRRRKRENRGMEILYRSTSLILLESIGRSHKSVLVMRNSLIYEEAAKVKYEWIELWQMCLILLRFCLSFGVGWLINLLHIWYVYMGKSVNSFLRVVDVTWATKLYSGEKNRIFFFGSLNPMYLVFLKWKFSCMFNVTLYRQLLL